MDINWINSVMLYIMQLDVYRTGSHPAVVALVNQHIFQYFVSLPRLTSVLDCELLEVLSEEKPVSEQWVSMLSTFFLPPPPP